MPDADRAPAAPTRLLVVRHGRTEWNAAHRWQGVADIPLDEEGRRQAAAAALSLGTFDGIWSSDLQRAVETAFIIGELLGVGPVQVDRRLRETDVGPWEGLNAEEVEAGWPGYLAERRRPEGFEDYDLVATRFLAAFADIARTHPGGEVLVVAHAGGIRATRRALGGPDEHLANLGGCWFTVTPDGRVTAGELVDVLAASS